MELRRVERAGDATTVVEVSGDIDNFTAPQLREELLAVHQTGARIIVVDLAATDFLDSSALGALVGVQKSVEPGGAVVRVVCTKSNLRRVFEITRMTEVVPIFDSVDEAVAG